MLFRMFVGGLIVVACIIVLGIALEITAVVRGKSLNEHGLFMLVVPMAIVSLVAAQGSKSIIFEGEIVKIFAFTGISMLLADTKPQWLWFVAIAYVATYALPVVKGVEYLFVRRPLLQHTATQRTLQQKLDADSELADATLRHERALAALADADRAVEAAHRRERGQQ